MIMLDAVLRPFARSPAAWGPTVLPLVRWSRRGQRRVVFHAAKWKAVRYSFLASSSLFPETLFADPPLQRRGERCRPLPNTVLYRKSGSP